MATAVNLDVEAIDRLVAHIRSNSTDLAQSTVIVPTAHFTDPARGTAEVALLKSLPMIVAHVCEVPDAGSFVARTLLGIPLLIVRQRDGSVAVFRNMCRHRGGRVEQEASGKRSLFMCQYHGWSYASERGELKAVPYEATGGPIDRRCNSLVAFPAETRHGLVFATLTEGDIDRPVADYLGTEMDAQISPWSLEESVILIDQEFHADINWKLVMDGTIDSLHAQFLHPKPGGVGPRTINHSAVFKEFGPHGKMFMARVKLRKLLDEGADSGASSKYIGTVMMLYPNTVFVEAPDHVELWSVWPHVGDPRKCTVRIRFLVRRDILSPEMEARVNKSWDILRDAATQEDFPMEAFIQENAHSWADGSFQYGRNEKCAQHLHRQLHRDIDGGVTGPDTISFR